jgi:hypothetical protein
MHGHEWAYLHFNLQLLPEAVACGIKDMLWWLIMCSFTLGYVGKFTPVKMLVSYQQRQT